MPHWSKGGSMTIQTRIANRGDNHEAALKALYDSVAEKKMFPFWATTTAVEHDEVRQLMSSKKAVPYQWRFAADIEPLLKRAAELVSMSDSERRSLIPG